MLSLQNITIITPKGRVLIQDLTLPVIENMLETFHDANLTAYHDRRFLRNVTAQRYLFDADGLHDITLDTGVLK